METKRKKVLVALSGGVDSSVAVHLLQQEGWEAAGLVLRLSDAHEEAVEAAQKAAQTLKIPLHVARREELFEEKVIQPFIQAYRQGRTPNPCILCNPAVKFSILLEEAERLGYDWIATGHYAAVEEREGRFLLKKAGFLPKDQSYMLYRLSQRVLSRLLLPLNALSKEKVRQIAEEQGLPCAQKPDSQEICFLPEGDYASYIERRGGKLPEGDFIAPDGTVCGRHRGILHYTVGQRKGLGIALGRPVFVREICPKTNRIYLADRGEEYAPGVLLEDLKWIPFDNPPEKMEVEVKIRSMAKPVPAQITSLEDERVRVVFAQPQRAPAPGQSAVFYSGDQVIGGGYIVRQL